MPTQEVVRKAIASRCGTSEAMGGLARELRIECGREWRSLLRPGGTNSVPVDRTSTQRLRRNSPISEGAGRSTTTWFRSKGTPARTEILLGNQYSCAQAPPPHAPPDRSLRYSSSLRCCYCLQRALGSRNPSRRRDPSPTLNGITPREFYTLSLSSSRTNA